MKQRKQTEETENKPFRGCGCSFIPTITGDTCENLIGKPGDGSDAQCVGDYLVCNTGNYCGTLTTGEPASVLIPPGAICAPVVYRPGETSHAPIDTLDGPKLPGINVPAKKK